MVAVVRVGVEDFCGTVRRVLGERTRYHGAGFQGRFVLSGDDGFEVMSQIYI